MDRVNWMLILTGEVMLVLKAVCVKTFQVCFVVLHRLRLSPWAHASSLFGKSLDFFTSAVVLFTFCLGGLSFPCGEIERSLTRPCGHTARRATGVFIRYCKRLLDNHWLNWWYRWRLWCLCGTMYSITRSGPLPLSPFLWWLTIIIVTHWNGCS